MNKFLLNQQLKSLFITIRIIQMAMFGNDNREQLQALEAEVKRLRESNRIGATQLAAARGRCAELEADAGRLQAELLAARALVQRARARQKNSVERANRLKKQLSKTE